MRDADIRAAVRAAKAFTDRAQALLQERGREDAVVGTRASGALRRASMDLTRALTDLRHPWRKSDAG